MECKRVYKNKAYRSNIINTILIGLFIILALNIMTTKSDKLFEIIGYRSYTVL